MLGKTLTKISDSLGTLITYPSIRGGPWPTMTELHDRLRQFRRSDALLRLCWCSALTPWCVDYVGY